MDARSILRLIPMLEWEKMLAPALAVICSTPEILLASGSL